MIETTFKMMNSLVCAVLVRKDDNDDAVRVINNMFKNIVTDLIQETEFIIVVVKSDEHCMLLDNSSVQYFHCCSSWDKNVLN